ncbi:quinone oxidoreductase [Zoogloea sp. 1C4]|uniref:quinone oxidoreductase family protein n=1 Tax=Zoogloea sp. 1C4 TaxID=2570190 RepID=UPI0012924775|nr:quinone oxidoreductase [Zoogloea sp. 1C4]
MTHLIRFDRIGGPDVLQWVEADLPPPAAGEVRIRHEAVGVNYIDTYHRSGLYPLTLPSGLGQEAAGVVEAVGEGVVEFVPGDRVAYVGGPLGAYSESRNIAASLLVNLPDSLSFEQGAAMMMQGLTAQYLLRRTYRVQPGDTILIHAAAGGVGLIVCQWAKALGATVIGTVSSDAKAEIARQHGCDHTIIYTRESVSGRVREITAGEGVPVVYDSIGKDTFMDSLACLRPLGVMVTFGNASGPVPAFEPALLARMGSLFLTRPTLFHYIARREDLLAMSDELFDVVASGQVRLSINQRYPLKDAAVAHRELEARRTTGSTVLLP